jgi:polysaccharide pyruvyl transferase WcaK-like protein
MDAFLKWYYGYKNLGDELLIFGVIKYCFEVLKVDSLTIEVANKPWMTDRIHRHPNLILSYDIHLQSRWWITKTASLTQAKTLKIFGGGEVLCPDRGYLHGGGNLYALYALDILRHNFVLLGGIGKPGILSLLYFSMLPLARQIICRDIHSYNIAKMYTDKVTLYHDFALDVLGQYRQQCTISDDKIAVINCNPYVRSEDLIQTLLKFAHHYSDYTLYFVPWDITEDRQYYYKLQTMIPQLRYYDWTQYNIWEICQFFARVSCGIGARLHILMLLHYFAKPFQALVYQDKITKILWESPYMQTLVDPKA